MQNGGRQYNNNMISIFPPSAYNSPGQWVLVNPSGTGEAFEFQAGQQFTGVIAPTDFFHYLAPSAVADQSRGGISRTNGLFAAPGGTAQWEQLSLLPGYLTPDTTFGRFAVNPRTNPGTGSNAIAMGSAGPTPGRIFRTTDNGKNWFQIAQPADVGSSLAQALAFGALNSDTTKGNPQISQDNFIYAGTAAGKIYFTITGGGGWKNVSTGLDGSAIQSISADPVSGQFDAYAVTLKGVYYMANVLAASPTWVNITGGLFSITHALYGNTVDQVASLTYLTSLAPDWRYANNIPLDANSKTPPVLYVGGDGGVFRSTDNGKNWTTFTDAADGSTAKGGDLPPLLVTSLSLSTGDIDPNTGLPKKNGDGLNMLVASTFGRGQYAIRLNNGLPSTAYVSGPAVTSVVQDPVTGLSATTGHPTLTVTFSGPVAADSFDPTDVTLVGPGNVSIQAESVAAVPHGGGMNGTGPDLHDTFLVTFAAPTAAGNYTLSIGPNVTDLAGNPMNQNHNQANGESGNTAVGGDGYTTQVAVSAGAGLNTFNVLGRLAGTAFLDLNADGAQSPGDAGLAGLSVYLDLNHDGVYEPGIDTLSTTNAAGRFDFGYLPAGNYTVGEVLYGGRALTGTASAGNLTVGLASGGDVQSLPIGNRINSSVEPVRVTAGLFTGTYTGTDAGNVAFVSNLYLALLNRPADAGSSYWVGKLDSGNLTRAAVVNGIFNSAEQFGLQVQSYYRTYLNRTGRPRRSTAGWRRSRPARRRSRWRSPS